MPTLKPSTLSARDRQRLDGLEACLAQRADHFIGYPCNQDFDYRPLHRFLNWSINNVGDPFASSTYQLNTKEFECEVLDIFAGLTHAPRDHVWGYVTNGGTEGCLYGLFLAREMYPDGVMFCSEDSHYSAQKNAHLLQLPCVVVKSRPDGCIDLDDLRRLLGQIPSRTPILFANIGTTMKGAIDNVTGMRRVVAEMGFRRSYVHADAAFSGMILPFVDDAPPWDFAAGVDSININGHKMIGSPIPCGIVLAKKEHVARVGHRIEYVGTLDVTISGSRNGITPLFLWYALRSLDLDGFRRRVHECFRLADYLIEQLQEHGIAAWRHEHSLTVVMPRPAEAVAVQWQLPVHGDIAHIAIVLHVTRTRIDQFVSEGKNHMAAVRSRALHPYGLVRSKPEHKPRSDGGFSHDSFLVSSSDSAADEKTESQVPATA